MRASVPIALGLLVATVLVYLPLRQHAFLPLDDQAMVVENPLLARGLDAGAIGEALRYTGDGNWIPLVWISFMVEEEIHGRAPGATQLGNALLHALSSVLLFLALLRMTGTRWPAAFTAAVFALHPLHVESVAWAIERKDVLSGLCMNGALLAYAGYAARGGAVRYLAVFALLVLGLAAKAMLVTLPLVLLLLDGWPLRRLATPAQRRRALLEKLPMLGPVIALSLLTLVAQQSIQELNVGGRLPLDVRLANAALGYATYLRQAFWPVDLAIFYPHPGAEVSFARAALCALGLIAVSGGALAQARARPWLLTGWLWFLGMLVPVIGLVQVGVQAHADRYTYLPLIGLALAVAWSGAELAGRDRVWRVGIAGAAAASLLAMAGLSLLQLRHWRDGVVAFERAQRRHRVFHLAQDEAEEAEAEHHPNVEDAAGDGERADGAEHEDHRHQLLARHPEHGEHRPGQQQTPQQDGEAGEQDHRHHLVHEAGELDHDQRPRPHPVDEHRGE